jgi:acyl-CoA dehydrogenase
MPHANRTCSPCIAGSRIMNFDASLVTCHLAEKLRSFFERHIYPNQYAYQVELLANRDRGMAFWPLQLIEDLKQQARDEGLWNLFLPHSAQGLSNVDYAPLCEMMGRVPWAAEVFNCSAPDTGNMEILHRYGTAEQQQEWLVPLLAGSIRSAFLMTEPAVASSDATNIQCAIRRDGDRYVVNGKKWWSSGAGDARCKLLIVMGKTDPTAPRYRQQSMILVPANAPGVTVLRQLPVFGYDHAPHGHAEVSLDNVSVPAGNLLLGEGRGFEIAQGRLGPGRIHHCMRSIGAAEYALELMCKRLHARVAFGKPLAMQSLWQDRVAESRCAIEQARLMVMKAAYMMDTVGNKAARQEVAIIKAVVPSMTLKVVDWAIQVHGAAGVTEDFPLAQLWATQRTLRLADGPDEVHRSAIAKLELAKYAGAVSAAEALPVVRGR